MTSTLGPWSALQATVNRKRSADALAGLPGHRRRGHARSCVQALFDWLRERGAGSVDLNASAEAEPLYASLGFVRKPDPSMRLTL
ncbi:GNAT family N-acetyltransferase [Streptomyces albidochromogenes]